MFQADSITATRRVRRALSFWRIAAILALAISFVSILVSNTHTGTGIRSFSSHIARVRIDGLITGDTKTLKLLASVAKSSKVKAVIIRINSPGGTTVGSEAIYEAIRTIAKDKPVVAVMDSVAASGGYITALAADHIVARGNTITGSIGVIFQWAEVDELLGKLGVRVQTIKSGPLKAEPDMFSPLKPDVKKVTEEMIRDSFDWFMSLVEKRRKLKHDVVVRLADGRVYTGRQAIKVRLIDEIGNEKTALKWLREKKKVDKDLNVVNWTIADTGSKTGLSLSLARALLNRIGLGGVASELLDSARPERLRLDGLLSVWQPAR